MSSSEIEDQIIANVICAAARTRDFGSERSAPEGRSPSYIDKLLLQVARWRSKERTRGGLAQPHLTNGRDRSSESRVSAAALPLPLQRITVDRFGMFDADYYYQAASPVVPDDPIIDYLLRGWRLGLEPGPDFDSAFLAPYFAHAGFKGPPALTFALLRAAGEPVYRTRPDVEHIARVLRDSGFFDADAYRARLGPSGMGLDPLVHYVLVGERLGLVPSDRFDPVYYRERYADVEGINALFHFLKWGSKEERRPVPVAVDCVPDLKRFDAWKETLLLVSHEASRSGAPILALNVGQELSKRYNVVVVLMRGGPLYQNFVSIAAHVICLDDTRRHPVELKHIVQMLLGLLPVRYAVVNSIESRGIVAPIAANFVPVSLLVHEFVSYTRPARSVREAFGWATDLVFPARVVADTARREHPSLETRKPHLLPQGPCDLSTLARVQEPGDELKRIRGAMRPKEQVEPFVVLGAGILQYRKGVDLFLAAAAAVRRMAPDLPFRFVWIGHGYDPEGDTTYSVYLAEQIERSDLASHVALLDEVTDLETAYALTSAFFLSSRLDPLPNVSIDAAIRGIPVVCFEGANGMAEILGRDPVAGTTVVPHLDVDAAARTLVSLAQNADLRDRVGEATRSLGRATFDMGRYVARIDQIGTQAARTMKRRRADFETIRKDDLFDEGVFLPARDRMTTRDDAIKRYLAYWSATLLTPSPLPDLGDFRRPCAGFHPQIYAVQHPEVLSEGVDPLADYIRKARPAGPWTHKLLRPSPSDAGPSERTGLRTAIQAHFHYPELIGDFLRKLSANGENCDLLLSTDMPGKAEALRAATGRFRGGRVEIRLVPNRGRDIGPLLTGFRDEIARDYDVVGHFHGKRSLTVDSVLGETWREVLWQHLIGDLYPMMDFVLRQFAQDEALGLVFAEEPHLPDWDKNRAIADEVAAKAGIDRPLPRFLEFPVGTMFWARTRALAPLLDLNLGWEDYPEEPIRNDGTVLHAVERLLPLAARKAGFGFATTFIAGITR